LTIEAEMLPGPEAAVEAAVPSVLLLDTSHQTGPSLSVTLDQSQVSAPVEETRANLDELWSELLEELQKRNIPTYSLVSTHAFPLALTATELTIGVLVETFQKMIEGKLEHIKAALTVVHGRALVVKVRIGSHPKPPEAKPKPAKSTGASRVEKPAPDISLGNDEEEEAESPSSKRAEPEQSEAAVSNTLRASLKNTTAHVVQEAYKLFEGPGSRLITSS
jgi:hypothetical protein